MNRVEIETALHEGRINQLEWITSIPADELYSPRTRSEHDPDSWWSAADHFIHTTLIERNFNEMVRRHVAGGRGMDANLVDESGKALRPREDLMAYVHAFTEGWKKEQEGKPLDELISIGLAVRSDTLALLSQLTDEQLASKFPVRPGRTGRWAASWPCTAITTRCTATGPKRGPAPSRRRVQEPGHRVP